MYFDNRHVKGPNFQWKDFASSKYLLLQKSVWPKDPFHTETFNQTSTINIHSLYDTWRPIRNMVHLDCMTSVGAIAFEAVVWCRSNFLFHLFNTFSIDSATYRHVVMRTWHEEEHALANFVENVGLTFTLTILQLDQMKLTKNHP